MGSKRVPELRFEGFKGGWEQRKLGEISEKVTAKNKNNVYSETLTNSAEFGIINQREFFDKNISNEKNLDGYYVVQPDDFVYNPRISNFAPVGPIKRNNLGRTGVMSPLYYVFRTNEVDKGYLEEYFTSNYWHIFMMLNGDTGARADRFAIKDTLFKEMPIPFPPINEQTQIGNFFKQLDERIALGQQELDTLKQTKQGFLKKMFPKEGESVPEVRFPGFTGEWEERSLNEMVDIMGGGTPSTSIPEYWGGEIDWYSPMEIGNEIYARGSSRKITELGLRKCSAKILPANKTILFTSRAGIGDMAILKKNGATNQGFQSLVVNDKNDVYFLFSLGKKIKEYALKNASGSTFLEISGKNLGKMKLLVPEQDEQIQIGYFFKQLDETIALQQKELDALKETKKAFLQKMFI